MKNYLNPGDVVIVISASGNSPNIIEALHYARMVGAKTVGLLGFTGGKARALSDIDLTVSSRNYGIAEDFHMIIQHIMTQILRRIVSEEEHKVIFLDRDGVINRKAPAGKYIKSWEDFEFLPGTMDALRYFCEMSYKLVILTNQQGVGKGAMSEKALYTIHAKMQQNLLNNGITIEKIFYCPHLAESNCGCRKPEPGLFYKAQNELNFQINMQDSFFIGDSETDIVAGNRAGCKTIYIGDTQNFTNGTVPTHEVKKLKDVVPLLRKADKRSGLSDMMNGKNVLSNKRNGRVRAIAAVS